MFKRDLWTAGHVHFREVANARERRANVWMSSAGKPFLARWNVKNREKYWTRRIKESLPALLLLIRAQPSSNCIRGSVSSIIGRMFVFFVGWLTLCPMNGSHQRTAYPLLRPGLAPQRPYIIFIQTLLIEKIVLNVNKFDNYIYSVQLLLKVKL